MRNTGFFPLTDLEQAAFNNALAPSAYFNWLGQEILCKPPTSSKEKMAGNVGFVFGALGSAFTFDLGLLFAYRLGLNDELATILALMILLPRIALNGNIAQDTFKDLMHKYQVKTPQPFKNNHPSLRVLSKSGAMVCVLSGAITNIYVNYRYLSLPLSGRCVFIPIACISTILLTMKPFFQKIDASFARYSPGATQEIQQKRAALIYAMSGSLQVIRSYDADLFARFYDEMSQPITDESQIQQRWERILELAQEAQLSAPPSWQKKIRGSLGWGVAFLASISNMSLSYGVSKWLMDSESLAPWFSVTAALTFTLLWTSHTQRIFEGKQPKPNWKPSHPTMRTVSAYILPFFGFFSAFPHAYWPLAEGKNIYEQLLSIPAIISPGALYTLALTIRLGRMLDHYDRYVTHTSTVEHMDFLKRLETLPEVIAALPDEDIDAIVGVEHPLLVRYRGAIIKPLDAGASHENKHTRLANPQ